MVDLACVSLCPCVEVTKNQGNIYTRSSCPDRFSAQGSSQLSGRGCRSELGFARQCAGEFGSWDLGRVLLCCGGGVGVGGCVCVLCTHTTTLSTTKPHSITTTQIQLPNLPACCLVKLNSYLHSLTLSWLEPWALTLEEQLLRGRNYTPCAAVASQL